MGGPLCCDSITGPPLGWLKGLGTAVFRHFGVWQMPQRESEKSGKILLKLKMVLSGELKGDRHDPLQVP